MKPDAAAGFLRRAAEFLASARRSFEEKRYNAAGFDGIQAMINANDALTAHFLGAVVSQDHREAVRLHMDVVRSIGDAAQKDVLKRDLDLRSTFGYLGVSASLAQAERVLRDAARFIEWVRRTLVPSR